MPVSVIIAGLGPGSKEAIPLGVWDILQKGSQIFLRTEKHPVVAWLLQHGIKFTTFDNFYERAKSFQEVYRWIVEFILREAQKQIEVVYAVPGHPLVAEDTVYMLLEEIKARGWKAQIVPAMSFREAVYTTLFLDPTKEIEILDSFNLAYQKPDVTKRNIVIQVYNQLMASDVKLSLMLYYPPEYSVIVVRAAGIPGEERVEEVPLYCLDRLSWIDHLTSIYLPPRLDIGKSCRFSLDSLVDLLATLRGEKGCPWDQKQTHQSLKKYLLEEVYEVLEAIDQGDTYNLCEELGDLLLQIIFHAQIGRENKHFDLNDIVSLITRKMIRRHPHVFAKSHRVESSEEVMSNWEKIKKSSENQERVSYLDGVPKSMPALLRASRIQARASVVGFDWPDYTGAVTKIREELDELLLAMQEPKKQRWQEEVGDLLFAVVNLARLLGIEAEWALQSSVEKFCKRFRFIEESARLKGKELVECTLNELDDWWEKSKKIERF